jgi:acyl carrier protein
MFHALSRHHHLAPHLDRPLRHRSSEEVVRLALAAHLECDLSEIRAAHHLERDLGITRLGLVLVALDLEDLEHVSLSFDELAAVHTVADLSRFLGEARRAGQPQVEPAPPGGADLGEAVEPPSWR